MLNIIDNNKYLIFQTAFIGDVALTFYLAQQIKEHNPSAEISFVTTQISAELADIVNCIDNVIPYDKRESQKGYAGIEHIVSKINDLQPEVIITPHRSFRSTLISKLAKKKFSIGFKHSSMSYFYDHRIPYSKDTHEILRNLTLLRPFNINDIPELSSLRVDISIPGNESLQIDKLLSENSIKQDDKFIVVAPGSVWETKKWGDDKFVELIRHLEKDDLKIILTGSKNEVNSCEYIANRTRSVTIAGQTSLIGLLDILNRASLVICNDSSPTHLAELMNTNVLTIYGPTNPEFGFAPRLKNSEYIQYEGLICKPCASHGSKKCPEGHHECMEKVDVESVYNLAKDMLAKT